MKKLTILTMALFLLACKKECPNPQIISVDNIVGEKLTQPDPAGFQFHFESTTSGKIYQFRDTSYQDTLMNEVFTYELRNDSLFVFYYQINSKDAFKVVDFIQDGDKKNLTLKRGSTVLNLFNIFGTN